MKTFDPDPDTTGRPLRAAALLLLGAGLSWYAYGSSTGALPARALISLWAFLVVAVFTGLLWWMPARLRYLLDDGALVVQHFLGTRRILIENLREVQRVPFVLGRRSGSAALPGYYVGRFHSSLGRLTAYAGRPAGSGVLLVLNTGEQVLLTPRRPEQMAAALERARKKLEKES